ncbi:hypothetical protein MIND_00640500 [Mycena indigotica]|uniref:MICOS complex subunit MIC12 n=1 Tax=Mycena indigotica TaxID=2126181 RepID=A0A8H6SUC6_9AGAR|nr:uncharacterized protein MIND_00640500 [Mycena indigotica]KAF7304090.1 hypothetical protein MIND_00640500 [Mycena indigotica]
MASLGSNPPGPPVTPPSTPPPNYGPTVSPQLIGSLLQFLLAGMLTVQLYIYHICFPRDPRGIKALVYLVFLLIFARTVLTGTEVEFWFASGFGDIRRFVNPHDLRVYTPIIGPLVLLIVELFFCYRIVALRAKAWPMALLSALFSAAQCACGATCGIFYFIGARAVTSPRHAAYVNLIDFWLICGVIAAVLTTGTITYILLTASVAPSTKTLMKNLIWLTIETTAIAASVEIVAFVLRRVYPTRAYWICPGMMLPGIYANTLLATLNNRALARLYPTEFDATTLAESTIAFSGNPVPTSTCGAGPRTFAAAASLGRQPSVMSLRFAAAFSAARTPSRDNLTPELPSVEDESMADSNSSHTARRSGTIRRKSSMNSLALSDAGTLMEGQMLFAERSEEDMHAKRAVWPGDNQTRTAFAQRECENLEDIEVPCANPLTIRSALSSSRDITFPSRSLILQTMSFLLGPVSGALVAGGLYYGYSTVMQTRTEQHRKDLHILSTRLTTTPALMTAPPPAASRISPTPFSAVLKERWNHEIGALVAEARTWEDRAGDEGQGNMNVSVLSSYFCYVSSFARRSQDGLSEEADKYISHPIWLLSNSKR